MQHLRFVGERATRAALLEVAAHRRELVDGDLTVERRGEEFLVLGAFHAG
jgi:hypothetical protein